ncbi:MAG: SDR family NAD(P)-dependent oxidoreductase, partial [Candidatus Aminicenantes bacterium]|nr:SDR family NAD(P)-dependent oxidoreductase [Candidatus Aminicenantes bacterium]NIM83701.1 SDR family NAD(P)-dependent oxidoreductase [Candidatus Aminicenantes bacterium]NIN23126.1 SDR family NAD(P)-dependent oxidoreductase [Candidatus Aminicenantes bacterium]NIN46853.1 SDR family NAD(P)-dependent oxidoreductase [Candidatus Aminicenantes bacterium]NIN89775.1 SDR family NAD(P)-dependent oxidoreductase [Candidatus Aminicenantes bacterium]
RNLIEARDCIHEIPDNRQEDIDNYFPYLFRIKLDAASKKSKKRYLSAAYLKEVDKFDYRFFRLSPKEASLMDPCQRIFMETAYEVLEDAGYAGKSALKYETGVYVGYSDDAKLNYFQMVMQVEPGSIPVAIAGNLSSIVPSRISYFMDLTGPSLLVDTACSSSLVAVHLACQAIRNGDCEQAIAGGVRVNLMPIAHTAKIGIESSDGKTRTFDDDSDGTGVGEGVGAVLLKPLDKALEDRDHIYAVIKGSAVNQDGQSLGITAPSADAQARLLVKAWKNANVDPETISYIEAHGTGTRVGDPIEVEGIINAFKQFSNKKQFCGIGSVKTNIGHLFEGAGIFGFIKAVLALKHRTLPPVLHFKRPNRNIAFEESPVYVVDELTPWKTNGFPLRCGVTAFGFSGTNCHLVLEEAPAIEEQQPHKPGNPHGFPFILALSAKSKESLLQLVKRYRDFLAVNHDDEAFIDICYTAGTGRQHLNHRLAVIAKDTTELLKLMKSFCGGLRGAVFSKRAPQFYYGEHRIVQDRGDGEIEAVNGKIRDFVESGRQDIHLLHDICKLYIQGADLEWGYFYKGLPVKWVCLPLYPFERKRCWIDIPPFEENVAKPLEGKLFFDMEWIEEELKPGQIVESETSGMIIVIKDENGVGEEVARSLKQEGRQVLEVTLGDSFSVLGNDCYQIDGSEAHYEKLLLVLEEKPIDKIIFMATLARKVPITSLKRLQQIQTGGAYNLFHLTKMLLKHYSTEKIEYVVIADYANKVTGKEKKLKPENAPLLGLAYAIDRECENFSAWCIDIDDTVKVDQLMAEIKAGKQYRAAAYRENRRYIERFIPIDTEDIEDSKIEIKNNGVYLITGGTGGIGLEMGKYLASKTKGVNIALVNRSKMPDRDQWEDILDEEADKRTIQKIKAIKEIEAMGATVCLFSVDCSGFRQMKQVLAELRERFGEINGIIHGAGVEGEGLLVRKSEKKFSNVLNPKVAGTWILDRLTKDDDLDFLVLFSTVATFLMNPGQTDYTAANAYLDTFSEYRNRQGKKTLAVNWVTWKETGMAVNFNANFDIIFKAIPTAQAIGAFDVVLNKKVNRVLIGELNLDSKLINLLKNAQFRLAAPIRNIIDAPDTPLKAQSADEQRKKIRKVKLTGREDGTYTRSELLVAKVWGEVLGFDELRIDDNFYELGGDSILATQVVNRINTENNLKISLIEIFNYETIKDLGEIRGESVVKLTFSSFSFTI